MRKEPKPYRIVGAYDSETTNIDVYGEITAFPILHQLGLLNDVPIDDITLDNVEELTDIFMYRHALDLYGKLDDLATGSYDYVPVILCHNLSFDMYGLSPWLDRHNVRVLAKSARKPITFTILNDDNEPVLVIWDTLIFTQQSLQRMGDDCGYRKAVGEWDYDLIRSPSTPLTEDEIDYARRDIYALIAWFSWWIKRNPDIDPSRLGLNVVTKTGIVRERRRVRFDSLKGQHHKYSVGRYWLYRCRTEQPKDNEELYTMFAATRGGLTFCSSANASRVFDLTDTDLCIGAYDAISQHPAQICSHVFPIGFKRSTVDILNLAFSLIGKYTLDHVLAHWDKPFAIAFYACFEFENLRPKPNSVFERDGVFPLASARYKTPEQVAENNGDRQAYSEEMQRYSYCDELVNGKCAFGKIISATRARLYITELTAWEIWQAYEFDSFTAIHGYETGRFVKPSDMDVISVMQFYRAKDEFKEARETYYRDNTIYNGNTLKELGIAPAIVDGMENATISDNDIESTYLGLKSDLNAIFGISCSNQYRRKTVLTQYGIEYTGEFGISNAPRNPKVWYQFGQRIVGYSRIAQICAIRLLEPHIITVVNGDTDSVKVVCKRSDLETLDIALQRLGNAIDAGKQRVCSRVKREYPQYFSELENIGHYVNEFTADRFCASWNKAYCIQSVDKRDGKRHFSFTLAGIPTSKRSSDISCFVGINGYADRLYSLGWRYADICNLFLGYNVTYAHDVIRMNARRFPEWASNVYIKVSDYTGMTTSVGEPAALAIYPMSKTVNDTASHDNAVNCRYALANNPDVNTDSKLILSTGVLDMEEGLIND